MKDKCHDCNMDTTALVVTAPPAQELTGAKPFWFISQVKFSLPKSVHVTDLFVTL